MNIEAIEAWGGNVWIEHWSTDSLYPVEAVGQAETELPNRATHARTNVQASFHVNLQWRPASRANIIIEAMYVHHFLPGARIRRDI